MKFFLFACLFASPAAASTQTLTLEKFLSRAAKNDTEFEAILIDALSLQYRKDARLPARDLVLSVREELGLKLDTSAGKDETSVSLSKLFPMTGTQLQASYDLNGIGSSERASSSAGFTVSQPIAENAFGKSTRLLAKIVGIEVEVARHQIVEAYEDYFASIANFYFDWYEAYENLIIARSSYRENSKLLDNMKARKKARVADQVDVDKVALQVLTRKERLLRFEERHATRLNLVRRALRDTSSSQWVPVRPEGLFEAPTDANASAASFRESGRTYRILRLLTHQNRLQTDREINDLLPSLAFFAGAARSGFSPNVRKSENTAFAGLSLELPFSNQVDRAEAETSRITAEKSVLTLGNTDWRLKTRLENLGIEMHRERSLWEVAREGITVARSVLAAETKNYTFGKISLNDYIDAVNRLDTVRFNEVDRFIELRRLNLEWLRLTDVLVGSTVLTP